mmetsp:Transcript_40974/g.73392  ORF Transcript_40974/g.73392 Transcript_40974/m.73392 type:complete len:139 (-) Transcript_40974:4-420(-)
MRPQVAFTCQQAHIAVIRLVTMVPSSVGSAPLKKIGVYFVGTPWYPFLGGVQGSKGLFGPPISRYKGAPHEGQVPTQCLQAQVQGAHSRIYLLDLDWLLDRIIRMLMSDMAGVPGISMGCEGLREHRTQFSGLCGVSL